MIDEDMPMIEFTANDRCDGCGAQAYALARHEDFGELLFCIHHLKGVNQNLLDEGWQIVEDYEAIERELYDMYPAPV